MLSEKLLKSVAIGPGADKNKFQIAILDHEVF